jgi:uncharacterized protein
MPWGARRRRRRRRAAASHLRMADLIAALGLLLVIEGLTFAAFPGAARRAAAEIAQAPEGLLRGVGLGAAVFGVFVLWWVRG